MESKNRLLVRLGKNLRAARERTGISQESFAINIGLDRAYYGKVERGEVNISVLKLEKITDALGIRINEVFQK